MEVHSLDKFKLITYQNLDADERNVLTLLYQPLLGCEATTLYFTLWSLIDRARLRSPEYFHSKIYDIMQCTPSSFIKARKKLEAVGLLIAYHNDETYLYELICPLQAEEFIKDGSLGAYLYNKVGKSHFDDLVSLFRISTKEKDGYRNISTHFDEIFDSLEQEVEAEGDYVKRNKPKIQMNHQFDFDVFLEGLSKNYVDRRKITKAIKDKLISLSYVYNLDEITMQKVFMDSVDRNRNIDMTKLSKSARVWFDFEKEEHEKNPDDKNLVSYQEMISKCKTTTPTEILSILSSGKPAISELQIIEKIMDQFELNEEVINFLLVYVIGNLGEFPSYNYFDKVASEWRRKKVVTVEEAIEVIKNRDKRLKTRSKGKEKNRLPDDIEADWLDDYLDNN
ncbi:MAG: DnaD domain protein [Candidatus Izimaplasma sp.]|nr:DnaD domain protein [Candidatus Izimaplasma bacterium]